MTQKSRGHVLALFTILIWGTTFITSKILLDDMTPLQVMLARFFIAYVVLLFINHRHESKKLKEEVMFFLVAVFGSTLYFICENYALSLTQASNVSILVALAPILTAILAHFFTSDEKLHRGIFLGFFVAFFGVILVVYNGTFVLKLNPLGDLLAFLAALMWAVYSILLKYCIARYSGTYISRKVCFYGMVTTIPLVLIEAKPVSLSVFASGKVLFCLFFLGVLGSGICYVTWNMATKWIGTVATNNYIYLNPFVTMVAAGIVLKEKLTVMGVIGAILIVSGIVISQRLDRQQAS